MDRLIAEYAGHLPIHAFLVSRDPDLVALIQSLWPEKHVKWRIFEDTQTALPPLFNEPPVLILLDTRRAFFSEGDNCEETVHAIKSDNAYSLVTVVLCLERDADLAAFGNLMMEADDFMFFPERKDVCTLTLSLAFSRSRRMLDVNPLSHLPGNTSIIRYIQDFIDRKMEFALAYADLDYFKAFNDKYGFSRGDEVLHFTARMISSTVRASGAPFHFVGHIGGDDFIFVLPIDRVEEAALGMIASFDAVVPGFYDADDRKRGSILTTDRQGNPQTFPILSLSVAVIFNRDGSLKHYADAAERASELKHLAKMEPGSVCRFDRRQRDPEEGGDARSV